MPLLIIGGEYRDATVLPTRQVCRTLLVASMSHQVHFDHQMIRLSSCSHNNLAYVMCWSPLASNQAALVLSMAARFCRDSARTVTRATSCEAFS